MSSFRVLSYNVSSFENQEKNRRNALKLIDREILDIICLQDVLLNSDGLMEEISQSLHAKDFVFSEENSKNVDGKTTKIGNAIISFHPILEKKEYQIQFEKEKKTLVYAKIKTEGGIINVYNTQLNRNSEKERLPQILKFQEIIDNQNHEEGHIFCGTFNTLSLLDYTHEEWMTLGYYKYENQKVTTDLVDYMSGLGYSDCFSKCKSAPTYDYKIPIRIDYIWKSKNFQWNLVECHRIKNKLSESASLHYPIVAEFNLPDRPYQKLNKSGKYLVFPGYTVISFLNHQDEIWKVWYDELKNVIPSDIYQILPLESFHMTVKNLFTLKKFKDEEDPHFRFREYLSENREYLKIYAQENYKLNQFKAKIISEKDILFGGTFLVELSIFDNNVLKKIEKITKSNNEIFGNQHKAYHITLAYKKDWTNGRDPSEKEKQLMIDHIKKIPIIILYDPTLCYFPDMQTFIPMKFNIAREKDFIIEAFCACKRCWAKIEKTTMSGIQLSNELKGKICIGPSVIPFGTKIKIDGDIQCVCTVEEHLYHMKKLSEKKIYLFLGMKENHQDVLNFGKKIGNIEFEYFGIHK